jgi:trk system potassium uptake protein TrkA
MKIIIAGAGAVGTHLAKLLAKENMDVILLDKEEEPLEQMTFLNMMTLVGSPTSIKTLKEAGIKHTDLFIAVTPNESVNIHACILAANMGAKKTVARIDNFETQKPDSQEFYRKIGINRLIYPELLGGEAIAAALALPWARSSVRLCDGHLLLLGVKIYAGAPIIGQRLMELGREHAQYHIAAIKRGERLIIPGGMDQIEEQDVVYFTTTPDHIQSVRLICGKKELNVRRVIIMGGSRIAIQATYFFPHEYHVTIIEPDRRTCEMLTERIPHAKIIQGNGHDPEVLQEADIENADAFVALDENSATNILACLTAKKMGVAKTVAEVENVSDISTADTLNISSVINKKLLTASSIYQLLLDADSTSAKCFSLVDAEVADLVAQEGSRITQHPVMQLGLPKGFTIGGLVRDGRGMTVNGQTQIMAGDHVVVVCMNEKVSQVEKLFKS